MRISVVGTRGIPGVHGGVERHCEELYPRVVGAGHEVRVYAREGYVSGTQNYEGVAIEVLPTARGRGVEALTHTAAAIRSAARQGCDILHIHSVGPCTLIPYARILGHRTIVSTIHAPDYLQDKWGVLARNYLRLGERLGVVSADAAICVAEWYTDVLQRKYAREVTAIPNGPGLVGLVPRHESAYLSGLGLHHDYVLFVGRLIPDKRVEDLLAAAHSAGVRVVVAGDSSDSDEYVKRIRDMARGDTLFVGYVYGHDLVDLYSHASAFVLPSSVEGLPISALEAMSFGVPVIMSDIAANREIARDGTCALLYSVGDVEELARLLSTVMDSNVRSTLVSHAAHMISEHYDWDIIASRTVQLYERTLSTQRRVP